MRLLRWFSQAISADKLIDEYVPSKPKYHHRYDQEIIHVGLSDETRLSPAWNSLWKRRERFVCLGAVTVLLIHCTDSFQHTLNNIIPWGLSATSSCQQPTCLVFPLLIGRTPHPQDFRVHGEKEALPAPWRCKQREVSAHLSILTMWKGLTAAGNFAYKILG